MATKNTVTYVCLSDLDLGGWQTLTEVDLDITFGSGMTLVSKDEILSEILNQMDGCSVDLEEPDADDIDADERRMFLSLSRLLDAVRAQGDDVLFSME